MNKKSRKFIKVLARKLIKGQDLKKKSLKRAFEKAVNELPESELQTSLQSNFTDAFTILRSQIEKLKILSVPLAVDDVQTISVSSDLTDFNPNLQNGGSEIKVDNDVIKLKRTKISDQHFNFPYNFYVKKNVLRPTASKAAVDQFYLKLLQNHTGMASVIKYVKQYQRRINEKSVLSALNQLLVISTGIKDRTFIKKLLYVYLTKMQPLVDKYFQEDNIKKVSNLQENLHKFLNVSHLRYQSSETSDKMEEKPCYNDLIASLLSLYLDLSIYLFRNEERKEKLSKLLYKFISYILVNTPQYKYDVLLQITQVNNDRIQLIVPLIKFCLNNDIDKTDIKSYIKYIITVAMVNNLNLPNTFNIDDNIKKARSVVAPNGTISWLKERVSEDVLDLNELNNDSLSFYLLENMTDSIHSMLIDSLCDKEGLELSDDEESIVKEKTQQDDVIVFEPDLSGFFTQDKIPQIDNIDSDSLFLIDRSGTSKEVKKIQEHSKQPGVKSQSIEDDVIILCSDDESVQFENESEVHVTDDTHKDTQDNSQTQKLSINEDENGITYDIALEKAAPTIMPKKNVPVRKIAVISPNSRDEGEPDKQDSPRKQKQQHKENFDSMENTIVESDVPIEEIKYDQKKDTKEIAEDVVEKKTSDLVSLSSPESKNKIGSPDSSKSHVSPSPVTSPRSSKKSPKTPNNPIKEIAASLPRSPQISSPDNHHCLRSPVTPKHCPCEDGEKKTPRSSLNKQGDLKSPVMSPKTCLHTTEIKSPNISKSSKTKTPKFTKIQSPNKSKSLGSLKKQVIEVSDVDEDVAIVAVTPGDKKSKHAIADWRKSSDAVSIVSDSEGTDMEPTPRKTRSRHTHIPDLSVHLTSKLRKTSGDKSSAQETNIGHVEPQQETNVGLVEPQQETNIGHVEPQQETIHVNSSSKEISSDSTITPEKCRRQSKGSKSTSDSDIIEMSGTPIKVTTSSETPARESRRNTRDIPATTRMETSSSTPSSTKRSRRSKAASEASDDISDKYSSESDVYMFSTDSEPVNSKSHAKRLSGQQMKAVLDRSDSFGKKPDSSEISTVRSPISLRRRLSVTSHTPSASKSRKVDQDSEVESRVRTRRMSESSVEDLKSQSSKDVTPSKLRKKDKTAAMLDTITESPTKTSKKSALTQSVSSTTPKKYSLRSR